MLVKNEAKKRRVHKGTYGSLIVRELTSDFAYGKITPL